MWQDQEQDIQLRRALLLARSGALRQRFGEEAQALQRPAALADAVRDQVHWWASRPLLLAALAAVPVVMRPRRLVNWSLKLWSGWRLWRRVQRFLPH